MKPGVKSNVLTDLCKAGKNLAPEEPVKVLVDLTKAENSAGWHGSWRQVSIHIPNEFIEDVAQYVLRQDLIHWRTVFVADDSRDPLLFLAQRRAPFVFGPLATSTWLLMHQCHEGIDDLALRRPHPGWILDAANG